MKRLKKGNVLRWDQRGRKGKAMQCLLGWGKESEFYSKCYGEPLKVLRKEGIWT